MISAQVCKLFRFFLLYLWTLMHLILSSRESTIVFFNPCIYLISYFDSFILKDFWNSRIMFLFVFPIILIYIFELELFDSQNLQYWILQYSSWTFLLSFVQNLKYLKQENSVFFHLTFEFRRFEYITKEFILNSILRLQ